jgi:hydrogenase maturation protease
MTQAPRQKRIRKVLLIGFGNPGRRDDGLGPALAAAIERADLPHVTVDADYQLTVEDAAAVAAHDVVVFADADVDCAPPFYFEPIEPAPSISFSTHSISPAGVLGLARKLFGARTPGWLLGIRGHEFDVFEESLSDGGRANLDRAVEFLRQALRDNRFVEVPREPAPTHPAADTGIDPIREVQPCKTAST